jgi:hypothetical protein
LGRRDLTSVTAPTRKSRLIDIDELSHGRSRPANKMGQVVLYGSLGPDQEASASRAPALQILLRARHRHAATICDHVEPHHGDVNRFWLGPFQSLCKECHDSTKRFIELHGFRPDIGLDG